MKRYLLFAYYQWEAQGGWFDYAGSFDTPEDAMSAFEANEEYPVDRAHIVDTLREDEKVHSFWNKDKGWQNNP